MIPEVGAALELEVGAVAHGGHCVARHDGQVVFVRHALPGERVLARITAVEDSGRYLRADAEAVLRAADGRREPPCPAWRDCGGCDWQHARPAASRQLKAQVVQDALRRFGGVERTVTVQEIPLAAPGRPAGMGWRTRAQLSVDAAGHAGMLRPRSHDVVALSGCPQLDPRLDELAVFDRSWPPGSRVRVVAPAEGGARVLGAGRHDPVHEKAAGRRWAVAADGFWQVHPGAADALVEAVQDALEPEPGERLVDLYSGVGLFGLTLAARHDLAATTLVEGDRAACRWARANARGLDVRVVSAAVERWVRAPRALDAVDLVVLDPPRVGAGRAVVTAIAAARPRAVAYVACDPVALARDVATFAGLGMGLLDVRALDLFPTTHHVECVATLAPIS